VLQTVEGERNILRKIQRKKINWIGHILHRNCLLKHVNEGKIEGTGDEDENVSSYWMASKKREDTGN
jgi:hypothetical protein